MRTISIEHFSVLISKEKGNTTEDNLNSTYVNSTVASVSCVTCKEVALERLLSLIFTFVACLFLCYIITALIVYAYKKKLLFGCEGMVAPR